MKSKDRVLIEVYGGTKPNSELDQAGKHKQTSLDDRLYSTTEQ